ncbi:SEN1 N terminal-domain-containing protein [Naematelia encephala]|uniref:SEN1 N terminal-domain-containing protein n=1 Tax=Naematelia encephala TaxID=71784 RepID=A0A1Y2B3Z8_9TREE|nr:SEN1 N terminal-domain-containing protein [Naematelia encephala]
MAGDPGSSGSDPQIAEVEAVLERRAASNQQPTDLDLFPVYNFLLPSKPVATSFATTNGPLHWYCSQAPSELHREAATYLIFLFAFRREGTSKAWLEALERVVLCCNRCARGFGAARRKFGSRYMGKFPATTRANFFKAVDSWQAPLILAEAAKASDPQYGDSASPINTVSSLSSPVTQLLLNEPSLLDNVEIASLIDNIINSLPGSPIRSTIVALGLTPVLIRLLSSPNEARRDFARTLLPACVRRPLSFDEFSDNGIGHEIQALYTGGDSIAIGERWSSVVELLKSKSLSDEVVNRGLLRGEGLNSSGRLIMSILSSHLGSDSPKFPLYLSCFAVLLDVCPTPDIWSFDPSAEMPHTLFSEIKNNPAFQTLLLEVFPPSQLTASPIPSADQRSKGKRKEEMLPSCVAWFRPFLLSLVEHRLASVPDHVKINSAGGFGEAIARVMGFCFQEMQHSRFNSEVRAGIARAGFEALISVQDRLRQTDPPLSHLEVLLSTSLDLHAKTITRIAFRRQDLPAVLWVDARDAAQRLLSLVFTVDGRDLIESTLGLAAISYNESKRQQRVKRAKKEGKEVPSAVTVTHLHNAIVRKDLWRTAYDSLSPSDITAISMLAHAVATFAHLDKLNRHEAWSHDPLAEVVKADDWITAIRAINNGLQASREQFGQAIESAAMQPDPSILAHLWKQPGMARSATVLLLSPVEDVHNPMISLIQQSFEDVDDRGDCFRVLLTKFPCQAMDGLCDFLTMFAQTAAVTPESCSLAKWLVRCFTDVLDALCRSSGNGGALLQSADFLESEDDDRSMRRRITNLWHLMTTSLAVIFKRTQEWAPWFDNEIMVDWMRDALIFGRQMTEHIRTFEEAALGRLGSTISDGMSESPVKVTTMGKTMVKKLEAVLKDLVSWIRLTDVETLHQTFELIKTILSRVARSDADLKDNPSLEATLYEIERFSRRAGPRYRTRLSDDLLSELADLLVPFNLDVTVDDEIHYIKSVESRPSSQVKSEIAPSAAATAASRLGDREIPPKPLMRKPKDVKNAFDVMMRKASGSQGLKTPTPAASKTKEVLDVDDFDDDFLSNVSLKDLDIIERRAMVSSSTGVPPAGPAPQARMVPRTQPGSTRLPPRPPQSSKLSINVAPKTAYPKHSTSTGFKSQFMKDARREHKLAATERKRDIGGITHRLPTASGLGTGLGAYQGQRRPVQPVVSSGSSDSDSSSDDENKGISALVARQKSPKRLATVVERRPIKILGASMADVIREREERQAKQHAIKMRLRPDLSPLFRHVLSWDPDHEGPMAPNLDPNMTRLGPVPTTFSSSQQYEQIMMPLFLQETWAQCKQSRQTGSPINVEITSRNYEDDFVDIDVSVQGNVPPDFYVNETDVVCLRQIGVPGAILAKVQAFRKRFKDTAVKIRVLAKRDTSMLGMKSKLLLQKHLPLSTALREFGALRGLPYYEGPLLHNILAARSARMPHLTPYEITEAQRAYSVNEPQATAILGAMSVEGFALIQGPPGTGKTKTISGLVGKFLSDRIALIPRNGEKPAKAKLLVCAPSNAAIDEVCKRLMNGVPKATSGQHLPNIVRVGIESSVNMAVKDVSLDSLVEARINAQGAGRDGGGDYARIQGELNEVKELIRKKQEEINAAGGHDEKRRALENEYHTLVTKRTQLGQQSSKAKDAARDATRHLDAARRTARDAILNEADVICATLSGAGQETLSPYTFETVIIDEAAQAIEMSCLIPLKYGCKRCIMVGDPNQLPPTTFSSEAERFQYNQSLFVRIAKQNPANMQLLSIQYRMHPDISELPSKVFYNGQLKDGPDMAKKTAAVWHSRHIFGPYRFFNVTGHEVKAGTSTKNPDEALVAVELYRRLEADFGTKINLALRIGVISMYKEQLFELKRKFNEAFGPTILERIEFNTVDGFQGQEKDIIILSCVRSGPNLRTIGFLRDPRRMNVALTRAKSSLFVIGNGPTLERSDERWKTIVGDARERGFFIEVNIISTMVWETLTSYSTGIRLSLLKHHRHRHRKRRLKRSLLHRRLKLDLRPR